MNYLHIGLSQLTLQALVPFSAQVLKWKWDIHIIALQCWNDNHIHIQYVQMYVPTHQLNSHGSEGGTASPAT